MSGIRLRSMHRGLAICAVFAAALALPARAQEAPATTTDDVPVVVETATEAEPVYDATVVRAPEPVLQKDSPLVAASKLAKRNRKKPTTRVITNATVRQATPHAHITTTKVQKPLTVSKAVKPKGDAKPAKSNAKTTAHTTASAHVSRQPAANGDADAELFGDDESPQPKPPHR
jgi:hypothetical protein